MLSKVVYTSSMYTIRILIVTWSQPPTSGLWVNNSHTILIGSRKPYSPSNVCTFTDTRERCMGSISPKISPDESFKATMEPGKQRNSNCSARRPRIRVYGASEKDNHRSQQFARRGRCKHGTLQFHF